MGKIINTLSQEQTKTLMESTWGNAQERDRQMLTFLLCTGLKIKEFVNLNVEDVYTGIFRAFHNRIFDLILG